MDINFDWSIDSWLAVFERLLNIFEEFFARFGYDLFAKDTVGGSAGE